METNTTCAGVDVAKAHLDLWTWRFGAERFPNTADGIALLIERVRTAGVVRVGFEASGGYQRLLKDWLAAAQLQPVEMEPRRVKAFGTFTCQKAKTDPIDAKRIAQATAFAQTHPPGRTIPAALCQRMTWLEQLAEDGVRLKTRRDGYTDPDLRAALELKISEHEAERKAETKTLVTMVKKDKDLGRVYALLLSLPGIGPLNALTLTLRMPELGTISREQAASLAGLAPFTRDSGTFKGQRRIKGGRMRVRRPLYMAAVAILRGKTQIAEFGRRLIAAGKPFKVAVTAVMRKLIILANTVLARGTPWAEVAP